MKATSAGRPATTYTVLLTGFERQRQENGAYEYAEIRMMPKRMLGNRHDGLGVEDTHIVEVTIEPEGWLCDKWVGMTLSQAKAVRAALDDCIRLEVDVLRVEVQS